MSPRKLCLASLCLLAAVSCLLNVTALSSEQLFCGIWTDASGTGMIYDFSSLTSDFSGLDQNPDSQWTYWLHVCGALTSAPAGCLATPNLSACQTQTGMANSLGTFTSSSPPTFSYVPAGSVGFAAEGVTYSMKTLDTASCMGGRVGCCYGGPGVGWIPFTATVNLVCNPTSSDNVTVQSVGCTDTYTLLTPLACGVASSSPSPSPNGTNSQCYSNCYSIYQSAVSSCTTIACVAAAGQAFSVCGIGCFDAKKVCDQTCSNTYVSAFESCNYHDSQCFTDVIDAYRACVTGCSESAPANVPAKVNPHSYINCYTAYTQAEASCTNDACYQTALSAYQTCVAGFPSPKHSMMQKKQHNKKVSKTSPKSVQAR